MWAHAFIGQTDPFTIIQTGGALGTLALVFFLLVSGKIRLEREVKAAEAVAAAAEARAEEWKERALRGTDMAEKSIEQKEVLAELAERIAAASFERGEAREESVTQSQREQRTRQKKKAGR